MNVNYNVTPKFNTLTYNNKTNNHQQQYNPGFTGISQMYDSFCHGVGKHFCRPIFDNGVINKMAYTIRNSENAVKHFLAGGSIITSSMYMHQTLTNDKMDKDRRQTLAVNQLFTLILSTVGAYTLDGKLKSWWDKQHEKYLRLNESGNAVWDAMIEKNNEIKAANKQINEDITGKVNRGELKPDLEIKDDAELNKLVSKFGKKDRDKTFLNKLKDIGIEIPDEKDTKGIIKKVKESIASGNAELKSQITKAVQAEDYVRKLLEPKISINDFIDKFGKEHVFDKETLSKLQIRSKGFSALRSILVFGFVYRFFVPLVVVKPTNILCEKYLEYKKAKQANSGNIHA